MFILGNRKLYMFLLYDLNLIYQLKIKYRFFWDFYSKMKLLERAIGRDTMILPKKLSFCKGNIYLKKIISNKECYNDFVNFIIYGRFGNRLSWYIVDTLCAGIWHLKHCKRCAKQMRELHVFVMKTMLSTKSFKVGSIFIQKYQS